LRKQQTDFPLTAISAEARALAAETALLVKKYGVLEEQVSLSILFKSTNLQLLGANAHKRIKTSSNGAQSCFKQLKGYQR